jgi:hypothetical protein
MTPGQRKVIFGLVVVAGRERRCSPDDVLRYFGTSRGTDLGLTLLKQAVADRDAADVQAALLVCQTFGFDQRHLPLLLELASADWHRSHEDVVCYLGKNYKGPDVVEALIGATQSVPDYLDYDEFRALARKAVWELGTQPGERARETLERIARSETGALREDAEKQLER